MPDEPLRRSSFEGVGPKGYRRSDERIREDVCDRLTENTLLDAGDIEVTVRDGDVILSGTVADRDAKRRAEAIIEGISGLRDIFNEIRVGP